MCVSIAPPVPPEVRMSPHHAGMGSAGSAAGSSAGSKKVRTAA
jgi:hypothetical protein